MEWRITFINSERYKDPYHFGKIIGASVNTNKTLSHDEFTNTNKTGAINLNNTDDNYIDIIEEKIDAYFKEHKLPAYFYQCFFGELVKIFGISLIAPDKSYLDEYDDDGNVIQGNYEEYSYENQIEYYLTCYGGTGGWNKAFKKTCEICNMTNLYIDYCEFDWVESDIFDSRLTDKILEVLFFDNNHQSYCEFITYDKN